MMREGKGERSGDRESLMATCVAAGLLLMLGGGLIEQFLGLPAGPARYAGLSLLPFAAFLVYLAMRENLSPPVVWGSQLDARGNAVTPPGRWLASFSASGSSSLAFFH